MRPLTDSCPKPLLPLGDRPLMQWTLQRLAQGACESVVINTAWLGEQISARFGARFASDAHCSGAHAAALPLYYSHEGRDFGRALETAGGVARALPLLRQGGLAAGCFWVVAGDVFAPDFGFDASWVSRFADSDALAHLWLVPNPAHNPAGDFGLSEGGMALNLAPGDAARRWTYSTIGLYKPALFEPPWCPIAPGNPSGVVTALAPLLRAAMDQNRVSASVYSDRWADVGTPERLLALQAQYCAEPESLVVTPGQP